VIPRAGAQNGAVGDSGAWRALARFGGRRGQTVWDFSHRAWLSRGVDGQEVLPLGPSVESVAGRRSMQHDKEKFCFARFRGSLGGDFFFLGRANWETSPLSRLFFTKQGQDSPRFRFGRTKPITFQASRSGVLSVAYISLPASHRIRAEVQPRRRKPPPGFHPTGPPRMESDLAMFNQDSRASAGLRFDVRAANWFAGEFLVMPNRPAGAFRRTAPPVRSPLSREVFRAVKDSLCEGGAIGFSRDGGQWAGFLAGDHFRKRPSRGIRVVFRGTAAAALSFTRALRWVPRGPEQLFGRGLPAGMGAAGENHSGQSPAAFEVGERNGGRAPDIANGAIA